MGDVNPLYIVNYILIPQEEGFASTPYQYHTKLQSVYIKKEP
nr:MAG TPA: hypothetical protein [Caudoviricetes sp.]